MRQAKGTGQTARQQLVVCVVPEGGSLFEIATPAGVWNQDRVGSDVPGTRFVSCGVDRRRVTLDGGVTMGGLGLLGDHVGTPDPHQNADMIIVPTWPVSTTPVSPRLVELLLAAHAGGTRIVGLCLGAFAVAATGLLDGCTAVTHWKHRDRFEVEFPAVTFTPDTLYVDHGSVITSAGSAAAVDCCLHLVREDHGAERAATIARSLVTAPHRAGTQSQFAAAPPILADQDPLSTALAEAAADIASIGSVGDLAAMAGTGRRSIERHMQARLGTSPKAWIDEQRVITACRLLETTGESIEEVARLAGYGSTPTMRRAFARARNTTPTNYRAMFAQR